LAIAVYKTQIISFKFYGIHETMNAEKFVIFLDEKVKPEIEKLRIGQPIILMDYATPHNSSTTKKYLNESGWTWLSHAPYSPGNEFD
jgi:hypothetical protein